MADEQLRDQDKNQMSVKDEQKELRRHLDRQRRLRMTEEQKEMRRRSERERRLRMTDEEKELYRARRRNAQWRRRHQMTEEEIQEKRNARKQHAVRMPDEQREQQRERRRVAERRRRLRMTEEQRERDRERRRLARIRRRESMRHEQLEQQKEHCKNSSLQQKGQWTEEERDSKSGSGEGHGSTTETDMENPLPLRECAECAEDHWQNGRYHGAINDGAKSQTTSVVVRRRLSMKCLARLKNTQLVERVDGTGSRGGNQVEGEAPLNEDHSHLELQQNASSGGAHVEASDNILSLRGRICFSDIKHLARSRNTLPVENVEAEAM